MTTILRRSISSVLPLAYRTVERRNHHHSTLFTALYQYGSSSSTLSHKPCPRTFASTLLLQLYSSSSYAEKETSSVDDTLVRAIESMTKSFQESDDHESVRFSLFVFLCCLQSRYVLCFCPSVCGYLVLKMPSGGCLFEGQISSKLAAFSFAQR